MSGDPETETKIADTTAALDDLTFDPSIKKKKKSSSSKKVTDDAALGEGGDDVLLGLKKKKKSKSTTAAQALEDLQEPSPAALSEAKENIESPASTDMGNNEGEDFDFGAKKKKKKKNKAVLATGGAVGGEDFDQQLEEAGIVSTEQRQEKEKQELLSGELITSLPSTSTRDFTYTELLARFFTILRKNNPELAGQASTKYKIPPPQAMREGNKKTIFANLKEISDRMHRPYEHVMQFLFAELGTSGSVDGSNRLVIKGRFQQKQLENVLRRYIMDYVTCKTCKNANTRLVKENRLTFIECQSCGSRRSVSGIKTGFQAHIGRRRKMAA